MHRDRATSLTRIGQVGIGESIAKYTLTNRTVLVTLSKFIAKFTLANRIVLVTISKSIANITVPTRTVILNLTISCKASRSALYIVLCCGLFSGQFVRAVCV